MNLDAIPLISLLRGRLGYVNQRQELLAQNVANADTPGYVAKDLKPFTLDSHRAAAGSPAGVRLTASGAGHIAPPAPRAATGWTPQAAPDSEATLDGNKVVLEEQMIKMTEARLDYDAAIGFYQKSLSLLRMAARRPGA